MRTNPKIWLVITAIWLSISGIATATERNVPSQYPTIQEAIDAAVDRDTVIVAPGTYTGLGNRDIDFKGKAITVRSIDPNDPNIVADTVIDCNGSEAERHRAFRFHSGEDSNSVISGLTITKGYAHMEQLPTVELSCGGAIFCVGSSPTISNCTMVSNYSNWGGGAIFCLDYSKPKIINCVLVSNTAGGGGGAIYCYGDSNASICHCTIKNNSAQSGGGICCDKNSSPMVNNCLIVCNNAERRGGGINSYGGKPTINSCSICRNKVNYIPYPYDSMGGGIYCLSGQNITNCLISHNEAGGYGGGICCSGNLTVINCTITNNIVYEHTGGAIYCSRATATVINSILWGNLPQEIDASLEVTFSNVQGGCPGIGNISEDPCFAFDNEFYLMPDSPCIDAGTSNPPITVPITDIEGINRPIDGDNDGNSVIDMGAFEFNPQQPRISFNPSELYFTSYVGGPNPNDQVLFLRNVGGGTLNWEINGDHEWLEVVPTQGFSKGEINKIRLRVDIARMICGTYDCTLYVSDVNAANTPKRLSITLTIGLLRRVPSEYTNIQAAIDECNEGDVVIVEPGVYTGEGNHDIDFKGKAITVRSIDPNDPNVVAATIIDCQGTGSEPHRGFNFHSGENGNSILAGFTIKGGSLGGAGILCSQQSSPTVNSCRIIENTSIGIFCVKSSPSICHCLIANNSTEESGGGIYCLGTGRPTIAHCSISNNTSEDRGGGIYCYDSMATIIDCVIMSNSSSDAGGGIACMFGAPTINRCIISSNTTLQWVGGGVYLDGRPTMANCIISSNFAGAGGGGICLCGDARIYNCIMTGNRTGGNGAGIRCDCGKAVINNCTISNNATENNGGGIFFSWSDSILCNCIVWNNSPEEIYIDHASPIVTFSDIQGGEDAVICVEEGRTIWGEGNIDAEPCFAFDHDYHLLQGSPCIDTGTNNPLGGLLEVDLEGVSRVVDGDCDSNEFVDMGAYEYDNQFPRLALDRTNLNFDFCLAGNANPSSQSLSLRNAGGGTLNWEVLENCNWLKAQPLTGESAGEVKRIIFKVDITGLTPNEYNCTVIISDPAASNSPQKISVRLPVRTPRRVPFEYSTIQEAIDACIDHDAVIVAPSVYTGVGNRDIDFGGKAITVRSIDPTDPNIVDRTIIDCEKTGRGFYFHNHEDRDSILAGFTLTRGNVTNDFGGAIHCYSSTPTIKYCNIVGNAALGGGGIYCALSNAIITHCTISQNIAYDYGGGGIHGQFSDFILSNCVITGNSALGNESGGGGIRCHYRSSPIILNCTLSGNIAEDKGGGIQARIDSWPKITNSIVWGNEAGANGTEIALGYGANASIVTVTYSDIEGGQQGLFVEPGSTVNWWDGNIGADPRFVDPDSNDYHLQPDSSCINAGDPNYVAEPNETDMDGELRVMLGRVDMGADEFNPFEVTFDVVNKKRIGRTIFEYDCNVTLTNISRFTVRDLQLEIVKASENMVITDPDVTFDNIEIGSEDSATSIDTCTFQINRSQAIEPAKIIWKSTCAIATSGQEIQDTASGMGFLWLENNTGDSKVDLEDLAELAGQWLWIGEAGSIPEDINGDGIVNLRDFAALAENPQ